MKFKIGDIVRVASKFKSLSGNELTPETIAKYANQIGRIYSIHAAADHIYVEFEHLKGTEYYHRIFTSSDLELISKVRFTQTQKDNLNDLVQNLKNI